MQSPLNSHTTSGDSTSQQRSETPADIETSSDAYALRFKGATGEWFLAVQSKIVERFLKSSKGSSILEVGGGHGQLTPMLVENDYSVTVIGSDNSCALRVSSFIENKKISFKTGTLHALPFGDRTFDSAICIRLLPHTQHWKEIISELCRVSAHSVIVEYPPLCSFNAFSKFLFSLKKQIEGDTRPYTIFTHQQIEDEFERCGFKLRKKANEFVLPMVLYRKIKSPALSRVIEGFFSITAITSFFGSPTIAYFIRQERE